MTAESLRAGQRALALGEWERARDAFEDAARGDAPAEALEGMSWVHWWLEDVDGLLETREGAYRLYRSENAPRGAARMALWFGNDHIDFLGRSAIANGWFRRAERLLEGVPPAPEHGWLAVVEADAALQCDDVLEAKRLAGEANAVGRRLGELDLEMTAQALGGLAQATEGHVEEGMRRLDEASAAALAGEYEGLLGVAWTCCYLIYACERVRDYDRAAQWCEKVGEFARRRRIRFVNGVCRVHYGSVLAWRGSWQEAERELESATEQLAEARPCWASEGLIRLGDLRRRQGRFDEAYLLFAQVQWHPGAELGMAELSLDRGDPLAARQVLERILLRMPLASRSQRVGALQLAVRLEAASGSHAMVESRLNELRTIACAAQTAPLRAVVAHCEGIAAAARANDETARQHFEKAAQLGREGKTPFEEASSRLEVARCLSRLGRLGAAAGEAEAAREGFATLGAAKKVDEANGLRERLMASLADGVPGDGALTPRQIEVLRLASEGLGDKAIAERLALSQHTVHRHVSNIYDRLGCSSRAAAVARGYRLGLL